MKKQTQNDIVVIVDEQHSLPRKAGNGILRYYITTDRKGNLLRYSIAYINHKIFAGDNGRVIGYDNDHGYHHRHYFGKVEPIQFSSHEGVIDKFEQEWREIHEENK